MIKLLLLISLLSVDSGWGYPSGTTYKTVGFSDQVVMKSIVEKASRAVPLILFIKGESSWISRINYSKKSLALVNFLISAIIILIVTMIILLIIILLNRKRMEKEEQLHQYLLEKYQSLIINYLFGSASAEEFRLIASDIYRRQVLIDQMIDVSINLKGNESKKLISLYKLLSLDKDSITKAHSRRWHIKIKGIRELAFMNIKDANTVVYKALNSSNEILRMEAQIALVRLNDDNPFEFLSRLTTRFSLWEQITLHELIVHHNIPLPSFQKWLSSPNPTVVTFALRMIREFKQKESEDNVRETLYHPDPLVRYLAVQVAGDLNMRSTLETMKHMYKYQEHKICLEIIKSMGKMPDVSMIGFLKLVLDKENDVQLQIEATKAIRNNGEEGHKALVKVMESEYKNYSIIIKHVLDKRIF
ncbi:MAG TPA: HEAT repeat domain-containing protein [Bacteroidales bacterium]